MCAADAVCPRSESCQALLASAQANRSFCTCLAQTEAGAALRGSQWRNVSFRDVGGGGRRQGQADLGHPTPTTWSGGGHTLNSGGAVGEPAAVGPVWGQLGEEAVATQATATAERLPLRVIRLCTLLKRLNSWGRKASTPHGVCSSKRGDIMTPSAKATQEPRSVLGRQWLHWDTNGCSPLPGR